MEAYQKAKEEALSKGQLVTTAEGEIVAVDEDRIFYADANSLGITDHKPTKAALDKLVEETKKRYVPTISTLNTHSYHQTLDLEWNSNFVGKRRGRLNDGRRELDKMMVKYRLLINGIKCLIKSCRGMRLL